MDAGGIFGAVVAGAAVISGIAVGVMRLYEKVLDFFTSETVIKLPKAAIPKESDEEG